MLEAAATIVASYLIGTIPIAFLAGRAVRGVDVREVGSGNVGASNVGQSVSKALVAPVGLAQIAQGLAAVMLAKAAGQGNSVAAAAGIVVILANDWNPLLRFQGGRGIGQTIGVLLALAPWALVAFTAVAVAGVALRAIPQFVAIALIAAPVTASIAHEPPAIVGGCVAIAAIAIAKRLLANGAPDGHCPRPEVWLLRFLYDRDIREREAWVRRGLH